MALRWTPSRLSFHLLLLLLSRFIPACACARDGNDRIHGQDMLLDAASLRPLEADHVFVGPGHW
jgi:hypothetical protein